MIKPNSQALKLYQQARNQRAVRQVPKKPLVSIGFIESLRKIQRWWRRHLSLKHQRWIKPLTPFLPDDPLPKIPSVSIQIEESLQSLTLNSSIQSKAADLFTYLEESESKLKPKADPSSYISQATLLNYRLELEESLKTIDSLKVVIQKTKKEAAAREEESKKILELALEKQKNEYEEVALSNMKFIEQLLQEKQQRIGQLAELSQKMKEMEERHLKTVQELKDKSEKELKKQKDAWVTAEKNKRNTWMKEKTKEIKENTTKGLEPEIMRILAENKRNLEKLKDEQEIEMKRYKQQRDHEYELKLQDFKEELKSKYDEMIEKERDSYQERLRELHVKQEEELLSMRKKWNDDMSNEKLKIHDLRLKEESSNFNKLKSLQTEHTEKIEEITKKNQAALEELEFKHENKLKKLKQELVYEKEEWLNSQVLRLAKDLDEKKEKIKSEMSQNRDKELKIIIAKLSEEKVNYKKKVDKETELKLKLQADKHEAEIADYEKLVQTLKDKIEQSTSVRKNLNDNFHTLGKKIQDQELQVSKLEGEKLQLKDKITELEIKIDSYKDGQGEVLEEVRKEERKKTLVVQQELEMTKEQIQMMKERYEEKLAQIAQKEAEEFEAIESRVKATIMRKDEKIREILEELQMSKLKVTKLEELLEKQRRNLMQI